MSNIEIKNQQIEVFYQPNLEFETRPDVGVDELFEVAEGYEGIQKTPDSPLYQTPDGEVVAFRFGPKSNKDLEDVTIDDTSNNGQWRLGPPSSFGEGVAFFNDPRAIGPHMFSEKTADNSDVYVVSLGKKSEELEYGSAEDRGKGERTLGAVAAHASVKSPAEFPYLQGKFVDALQRGSGKSVLVFGEKFWVSADPRRHSPGVEKRWILVKPEAVQELKVIGRLKRGDS